MLTQTPFVAALASVLVIALPTSAQQLIPEDIDVDGVAREYLVYLPAGYDGTTDLPVLLVYHGGDMTSQSMLQLVDMRPLADAHGFLAVYPQGLVEDGSPIWNSEGPFSNGVDEIGFTSEMIDALAADYAVDQSRVYACGYSNGGNMAWELACLLSERIAAVAAVAGSMWEWTEDLCVPTRPVPVSSIHGTFDFYNPYNGGPPFSLGLIAASEYWAQADGANPVPTVTDVPNTAPGDGSTVDHFVWADGDDCVAVEHYKVVGGGHDWPGVFGNMDIDASELIWSFVSKYDLSGRISAVVPIGVGAGGANIGSLDSSATPSLGELVEFELVGFNGAGSGLLLLGLQEVAVGALGGTVYVVPSPAGLLPVETLADGSGSVSFSLPSDPTLAGIQLYAQAVVADGSQVAGVAFSNGLALTVCQ